MSIHPHQSIMYFKARWEYSDLLVQSPAYIGHGIFQRRWIKL